MRIWDGDELPAMTQDMKQAELVIETALSTEAGKQRLVADITNPRGARIVYGLLGATYTAQADSNTLQIIVHYVENSSSILSLSPTRIAYETVFEGLPPEFLDPVLQRVRVAVTSNNLGGGQLNFDKVCNTLSGSCTQVYNALVDVIIRIFASSTPVPDDELISIVLTNFRANP